MSTTHVHPCCLPLPSPRLLSSTSRPFVRLLPGLTMQRTGSTSRLCLVVSRCAADVTSEPEPSPEDPAAAIYRNYRDEMDKYERGFIAALRQEAMVAELEITLFRDENDKLQTYMREIASNRCILYEEGRGLALMLCSRVDLVIHLSAKITANARLRVDGSSGISFLTVEQIIRTYISTFLKIVEDTCHRKVDRKSIILFLDALRGLAAISHILIKDALNVMNDIEDCSKSFNTVFDVDALNHELECNMKDLEINFTSAWDREVYELLWSTLTNATDHVSLFVIQMTNLRKKVLTHVQNHVQGGHIIGKEYTNDKDHTNDKERTNGEQT